jgi:hypothetical protein
MLSAGGADWEGRAMRKLGISLGITMVLTAVAAAPSAAHTISPPTADFGQVRIGGGGGSIQFTLTAAGSDFYSSDIKVSGPDTTTFTISPNGYTCNMQGNAGLVPAGSSCNLTVLFFPRTPGVKTGTVGIPGATATLTGTAVAASKKKCKKGKKKCKKGKKKRKK